MFGVFSYKIHENNFLKKWALNKRVFCYHYMQNIQGRRGLIFIKSVDYQFDGALFPYWNFEIVCHLSPPAVIIW